MATTNQAQLVLGLRWNLIQCFELVNVSLWHKMDELIASEKPIRQRRLKWSKINAVRLCNHFFQRQTITVPLLWNITAAKQRQARQQPAQIVDLAAPVTIWAEPQTQINHASVTQT